MQVVRRATAAERTTSVSQPVRSGTLDDIEALAQDEPPWLVTRNARRWWEFHVEHQAVESALAGLARKLLAQGHRRISIAMLWETLRYRTMLDAGPDESGWRLNNNHRAYYARWLMEQYDDLRGVFSTRELHADDDEGNDHDDH